MSSIIHSCFWALCCSYPKEETDYSYICHRRRYIVYIHSICSYSIYGVPGAGHNDTRAGAVSETLPAQTPSSHTDTTRNPCPRTHTQYNTPSVAELILLNVNGCVWKLSNGVGMNLINLQLTRHIFWLWWWPVRPAAWPSGSAGPLCTCIRPAGCDSPQGQPEDFPRKTTDPPTSHYGSEGVWTSLIPRTRLARP